MSMKQPVWGLLACASGLNKRFAQLTLQGRGAARERARRADRVGKLYDTIALRPHPQAHLPSGRLPVLPRYCPKSLRQSFLFGARWPHSARVAGRVLDCPLVRLEDNSLLGVESLITAHYETNTGIRVGRVSIGKDATVGMRAVVLPGATVEDGAIVGASALVPSGRRIPVGETWAGIPARPLKLRPATITLPKRLKTQEVA